MINYFEHIDDYLFDRLSDRDRSAFEKAMKEDQDLYHSVEEGRKAKEILLRIVEEESRAILQAEEQKPSVVQGTLRSASRLLKIAAALLVLIVTFWLVKQQMSVGIEDKSFTELMDGAEAAWPGSKRGGKDQLGLAVYQARKLDLHKGVSMIKALDTTENVRNYWIAEVFLEKQKADSVLKYLPQPGEETMRRDRIFFVEIMAYKLKGEYEKIRQLQKQLPDDMDDFYLRRVK